MRSTGWAMLGMCCWLTAGAMSPPSESFDSVPGTVAYEDFDSYGDTCPIANDGFAVEEFPMGRKHLTRRADGPAWVFRTSWPAPAVRQVPGDRAFAFRFLFGGEKRELQARLDGMADGKRVAHTVIIRRDRITLSGPVGLWGTGQQTLLADVGMPPLAGRTWYRCRIETRAGFIRVSLEDRGDWVKVAENTCPAATDLGLNLLLQPETQVSALRLHRLAPLPVPPADKTRAQAPKVVRIPMAPEANAVGVWFSVGQAPTARMVLLHADGTSFTITPAIRADSLTQTVERDGKRVREKVSLPDAIIGFRELKLDYHSRPFARRYTDEQAAVLQRHWEEFPAASQRLLHFECRQDEAGIQLWIDGKYAGRLDSGSPLSELSLYLPTGAVVRSPGSHRLPDSPLHLPLDAAFIARPGAMAGARLSMAPGRQGVAGVPMIVADGAHGAAIDAVKEMKGSWALEADEFLSRGAFDGMPESLQYSVPLAWWNRAWVLCATEADPAKDTVLTARLTRDAVSGRGDAIADTSIVLPRAGAEPGPHLRQVGTVTYASGDKPITVPLWLADIPLDAGSILDLLENGDDPRATLQIGPYLDFALLGKLDRAYQQLDRRHKPDPMSTSGVHVFGVTLERSPVALRLEPGQPGNIFGSHDKPVTVAHLRADLAEACQLSWEILDDQGAVLKTDERETDLTGGQEAAVEVPLTMPDPGWYGLRLEVKDSQGRAQIAHEAAFALLPPDRRKAGCESPYGTWWFAGAHYGCADVSVIGPMLAKAGLRRTTFGWSKAGEAEFAPWKVGLNQIGRGFNLRDLQDPTAACEREEKRVNELLARFPHCPHVLIFHESWNNQVPPELRGESAPAAGEREQQMVALANLAGKFYREKFPQLKLVWGNSSCSASIIAMLLRNGLDASYIDYIGIEAPGQTSPPEKLWEGATQGTWLAREVAHKLGHDLPVTGCYEFTARSERDLGPVRHAEWVTRDILLGLAYRFPTISPAIIHDVGNAYYNTLWGAGGLCRRSPLLYPKPAYVAVATLTNVLDSVALRRALPTGSATVYALEFDRGGQSVYALWTVRGEAELALDFGDAETVRRIDMFGREEQVLPQAGRVVTTVSTSPCYLESPIAATRAAVLKREYPRDRPAVDVRVADPMADLSRWALDPDDKALEAMDRTYLPWRTAGEFELRQVKGEECGACLEVELKPRTGKSLSPLVGEYTVLRLKSPVAVNGMPATLGVWVKGNSNWGSITWEIRDSEGEVWRSIGTGGWGCDIYDWPGETAVNFDGWAYLRIPLTEASPVRTINPGGVVSQWVCDGAGNKRIDFPIQLTALGVTMYRQALTLTEMRPVESLRLRLQGLGAMDFTP